MRRPASYRTFALALLGLWLATAAGFGQTQLVDGTHWPSGRLTLSDGWREHDGDNLAWAQTNFDDTGWTAVSLDGLGPARVGWRWYRLHVKIAAGHPHLHLLIAGGEGTYELYLNGEKQADTQLQPLLAKRPTEQIFSLDDDGADVEIALRTYATPTYTSWNLPLFLTAAIGTPGAIDNEQRALQSRRMYRALPSIAVNAALMLAGIAAFALFRTQRRHAEYLWLGLYLCLLGLSNFLLGVVQPGIIPLALNNLVADPVIYLFAIAQIEFTFSFAGTRVSRPWRVYEALLLVPLIFLGLMELGRFPSTVYLTMEALAILPAALILPVMLLVWYRRGNREAGWLIVPSLLPAATSALTDISSVSMYTGWGKVDFLGDPVFVGSVPLQTADLGDLLFLLAIGVVMFFRFTRVSREQARTAAELDAARTIQRRLVPETLPEIAGYVIEAAYFPADEVGGDFYQVLESTGGAKLVVVGDVSGKGLKAAMTGTLAMGAVRALATEGLGPGAVLERLNQHLAETNDEGFVTCVCARITPDGDVTVANAGHLPPYRNGEELLVAADLPLGILAEQKYADQTFRLERDTRGALFGFERTRAISNETAGAIASAALQFGQEDDITVLTLTRAPAEKASAVFGAAAARG